MALHCVRRPTITYDLAALASDSYVSVGRETDAHIQLDSQDVPCLLSRKHASLVLQPGGHFAVVDLGSTNGTFAAKQGQPLRKLPPGYAWELQHGDTIGFGGPETIIVKRSQVGNPFLFKYYTLDHPDTPTAAPVRPPVPSYPLLLRSHADQSSKGLEGIDPKAVGTQCSADDSMLVDVHKLSTPSRRQQAASWSPSSFQGKENKDCPAPMTARTPTEHRTQSKLSDILSSHLSCPVCCEWLLASHTLPCGHMFCGLCLATWVTQNQSCPSCRKTISGVPVRCFQVDATINELLAVQPLSPTARRDRKRKQEHWDNIQLHIVQDWASALQRRRDAALSEAARHNQEMLTAQPAQRFPAAVPAAQPAPPTLSVPGVGVAARPVR